MSVSTIFFFIAVALSLAFQDTGWIIAYSLILVADAIAEKRQTKGEKE